MKRLLILLALLPLLIGVTQVRASEVTIDGVTIVETVTTENMPLMGLVSPAAVCKSQAHRIDYYQGGVLKAWTKLKGTTACWSACGVSLENASRSHWAADGWKWTWGLNLLGGRKCKYDTMTRYTYDYLNAPGQVDYWAYHRFWLKYSAPLKYTWDSWSHPVIPGQ